MRRIISLVLIFCLLHTSTYAAVADLAALSSSPPTPNSQTSPSNQDSCTVVIPTVENTPPTIAPQKSYDRKRRKEIHPIALGVCCVGLAITAVLGGRAIWSALQPQPAAPTDMCMTHISTDRATHVEQKSRHAYGESLLEIELEKWLNHNGVVIANLEKVADSLRHRDEDIKESWAQTQKDTFNALHNHGIATLRFPISCDIQLGDGESSSKVTECRSESLRTRNPSADSQLPQGVDAQLWLFPLGTHGRFKPDSIRFIAKHLATDQLYPSHAQSLGIEAKHDSRRMLLQAGNTLTLPQAIQATLNNRNDVKQLLAKVAENLRQWNPSTAEITALNTLIKSIFDAHGYVMTGDVQCGFASGNEGLVLADCTLMAARRAVSPSAAQQAGEKATFRQSLQNPVKFDGVDVEAKVLPSEEALPLVLQRAADPLHGELDQLRQDRCSPEDQSRMTAISTTVYDALATPNVKLGEDMACDVTVRNGNIHIIRCSPDETPESAVCGTLDREFAADGRVWIKPNGALVISANRDWNTTATAELPHTLTSELTRTPTVPLTPSLYKTESKSLPVVERPVAPANTTTRLYWANFAGTNNVDSSIWVAEVNHTSGGLINPRLFVQSAILGQPGGLHVDEQNGFVYWGQLEGPGIFRARLQTNPPGIYDNITLLSTPDTQKVHSMYLEGEWLHWVKTGSQLFSGRVDPANPTAITDVKRPSTNPGSLGPNSICPLSSPVGLYVNSAHKQLVMSCKSGGVFRFNVDTDTRMITQKQPMSTKVPEDPQSSAVAPELGRVFFRSPGKLYGADIDLGIPAVTGFETLISNTTMVKYYDDMSVVPNATEWSATTTIYWAIKPENSPIWKGEIDHINGRIINVEKWIDSHKYTASFYPYFPNGPANKGYLFSTYFDLYVTEINNYTTPTLSKSNKLLAGTSYGSGWNVNALPNSNTTVLYVTGQSQSQPMEILTVNTSNPSQKMLRRQILGRFGGTTYAHHVDEAYGRIYRCGNYGIQTALFPQLTNWTSLSSSQGPTYTTITACAIKGNMIYWKANSPYKIYEGVINRSHPTQIAYYREISSPVLIDGNAGGLFVQ